MKHFFLTSLTASTMLGMLLAGCQSGSQEAGSTAQAPTDSTAISTPATTSPSVVLELVAQNNRQWTGITIAPNGRRFVNFPRWSADVPVSVAELLPDGTTKPWPDAARNAWQPGASPDQKFACVQSVVADSKNRLWVVDPNNSEFKGVLPAGPRLHVFDIASSKLLRTYKFPAGTWNKQSYLNDVRVDVARNVAYLTDSGSGALLAVELGSGQVHRQLATDSVTKPNLPYLTFNGEKWTKQVHSDGIELSGSGDTLYFSVLTGDKLFRVPTRLLRRATPTDSLHAAVQTVATIGPADGLWRTRDGRIWSGALTSDAIRVTNPRTGQVSDVVKDARIRWADTFAEDANGYIYFTTSQLQYEPTKRGKYEIYRFRPQGK
ncbi:L-dopachrome tautomerase-related protein [Hymenobacter sp. DG25B]|uniref:L-dopachrome tautomerase-related protein n=1 Tax=Hymenobacter sp. DG25B TaxID=1385664 RepID=UPI0012E00BF9|nr:L-dopachrome tautomerase-related protein [Hymenobacter sp. DG25B]